MKNLLASLTVSVCVLTASATAAEIKGCYAVRYSQAFMQAHPGKTPRFLSVKVTPGSTTVFNVKARLRGKTGVWTEGGICDKVGSKLDCSVECDGGGFTLSRAAGSKIILRNTRGFRVAREACNGEVISHMIDPTPGNRRFVLHKRPLRVCR
jgi:hypothetical protein